MQNRWTSLVLGLLVFGWTGQLLAGDQNPTGTWKWSVNNPNNNQAREAKLQLKLEGTTLTGSIPGPNKSDINIENASYKDDQVSFSVTRERNGQKTTQKFSGKLDGDTITGTIENPNGKSREWVAKRDKAS